MNFDEEMKKRVTEVRSIISKYLPEEDGFQRTLLEAMNYSMLVGGKKLRPLLMQQTYVMFGGSSRVIQPFMAAIEMVHTYSLVHDDLPCMDNDEYRRGRKTTHVVFGEGMAVLAGDGLLNLAFETAAGAFSLSRDAEETKRIGRAFSLFARKSGIYGMIGGQNADIEAEDMGDAVTEEMLLFIHEHKTAALIQSAMMTGAILAGASEEDIKKIGECADRIGIAFQIQDDILDVTSSLEVLGKQTGSDDRNHKTTYVTLKGIEQAMEDQKKLSEEAIHNISSFEHRNEFLEELVRQLITREK